MRLRRRQAVQALFALLASPGLAQGSKVPSPFDTDLAALKPGQWIWDGEIAPAGPMMLVVNLAVQQAWVYRNGLRIGASTVSSGKKGYRTPTGIFQILQKNKDHRSNLYNDAPMPYMQRLTWTGIALHAGNLPGYPASHGCIRTPLAFAEKLFEASSLGMIVVIVDEAVAPEMLTSSSLLARFAPAQGSRVTDAQTVPLGPDELARWRPERSLTGPVTIVLSTASKRLIVYRGGIEIGRSRVAVPDGFRIGTRAAQFAGRDDEGRAQWIYIGLSSYQARAGQAVEPEALAAVTIPPLFQARLRETVGPGTTLLATDGGLVGGGTGKPLTVLTND
jgi:hypothetical protein